MQAANGKPAVKHAPMPDIPERVISTFLQTLAVALVAYSPLGVLAHPSWGTRSPPQGRRPA
jgi:hypothetical protein